MQSVHLEREHLKLVLKGSFLHFTKVGAIIGYAPRLAVLFEPDLSKAMEYGQGLLREPSTVF
jgi:hypothetical protein